MAPRTHEIGGFTCAVPWISTIWLPSENTRKQRRSVLELVDGTRVGCLTTVSDSVDAPVCCLDLVPLGVLKAKHASHQIAVLF